MAMSDQNEKLSSLMDEYRHTDQDQSVLNELQGDVNQQYTMQRYQMVGDIMRKELPDQIRLDFAAAVRSKIEHEPAYNVKVTEAAKTVEQPSWFWSMFFKPVAGLAVAAAVAVVTITTFQAPTGSESQSEIIASSDSSQARIEQLAQIPVISNAVRVAANPQGLTPAKGMTWKIKRSEPEMQSKLNTYLVNHNEYSNSMQGLIPQARVVGFDGQR